eukprot:1152416-Pelagomonas_calceolata.AAC.2
MAWLAVFAFASLCTEVFLYFQTSEAWHSELRGLMTGGMSSVTDVWSVWAGRRAAGFACLASICCAWGVGLGQDVDNGAMSGIRSWIILAKGLPTPVGVALCRL